MRFFVIIACVVSLLLFAPFGEVSAADRLEVDQASSATVVFGAYDEGRLGGISSDKGQAMADVNGDGFDDWIIGAPWASPAGDTKRGEVHILYGGPTFFGKSYNLAAGEGGPGAGWTLLRGSEPYDMLGHALATGDVDGDGLDDVLIGARGESRPGVPMAGRAYVLYGSPGLPGRIIDLADYPGLPAGLTRIEGDDAGDLFGQTVELADFDHDGRGDLLISAFFADTPGGPGAGEVYLLPGSVALREQVIDFDTDAAISPAGEYRLVGTEGPPSGVNPFDAAHLGSNLCVGDFNGDGYQDAVLGSRDTTSFEGLGWMLFGPVSGPPRSLRPELGESWGALPVTMLRTGSLDVNHGPGLAAGDANGDGFDDLLLGAHHDYPEERFLAGRCFLMFGFRVLPGREIVLQHGAAYPHPGPPPAEYFGALGATLGLSMALGDHNGDGLADPVLSAYLQPGPSGLGQGASHRLLADAALPGAFIDMEAAVNPYLRRSLFAREAFEAFGANDFAGGDLDGDGRGDISAGALEGDNPVLGKDNHSGYAVAMPGEAGGVLEARAVVHFAPGATPWRGLGGPQSPGLGLWMAWEDGSGPGGGPSSATVTLWRGDEARLRIANTPFESLPLLWRLESTRQHGAPASITLRLPLGEYPAALPGDLLRLHAAPGPSGPWQAVATQQAFPSRRRIEARLDPPVWLSVEYAPAASSSHWVLYD